MPEMNRCQAERVVTNESDCALNTRTPRCSSARRNRRTAVFGSRPASAVEFLPFDTEEREWAAKRLLSADFC